MKKIAIIALAALAFTACDNYELPMPQAPVNAPDAPFSVGDVQFATDAAPIVLTDETPEDELIQVGTYVVENWPDTYEFAVAANASDVADFSTNVINMNIDAADGAFTTTAEHLTWAVKQLYGSKGDVARTIYLRYQILAQTNGVTDYIVGDAKEVGSITVTLPKATYDYDVVYTPGPANDWTPSASMGLYPDADYQIWSGYAVINEKIKFSIDDAWSVNWGGAEGVLKEGGPDIEVETPGLYFVKLNLAEQTYELTPITAIGVIGEAALGWETDVELAPVDGNYAIWGGEVVFAETGGWKFRMNNAWTYNLGGAQANLVQDGTDLDSPGAGTYTVTLDLSKYPYTYEVVGD